jgi:lipid A 1-phosphatase
MQFGDILREPARKFRAHPLWWSLAIVVLALVSAYPSNLKDGYDFREQFGQSALVQNTEEWGRLTNTVLQIAVPLIVRDITGLKQLVPITLSGILASHGPKRVLNNLTVGETRLGQRPSGPDSKHNMPSGHSTLAASAVVFLCLRYGLIWAVITLPILVLTMYTRVMLDAHTISAVLAGALTGGISTALFTTPRVVTSLTSGEDLDSSAPGA